MKAIFSILASKSIKSSFKLLEDVYEKRNNEAMKIAKKGWKPWELSMVLNPDPSQLSLKIYTNLIFKQAKSFV